MKTIQRDYEALFRSVSPRLWRAIFIYAGGRRDVADEAVSEAFARAISHDGTIRKPDAWLYTTAFRIAAAELRREHRDEETIETGWEPPLEAIEILSALRRLSANQRAAVYLHYQADLPVATVARFMGTSPGAVKVHLFRGRKRLRELLGAGEVHDD